MIKTMLGEMCGTCKVEGHGEYHKSYLIEGDCGRFWVSEEELKRIKLPTLEAEEREYYDEVKLAKNGDKIKMTSDITSNVINGCCPFTYGKVCEIIEAIVKGGYNK